MLKIIEKKKIWFSISIVIILIGLGFIIGKGLNFGIDFAGGKRVVIDLGGDYDKKALDEIVKDYAKDPITNTLEDNQYEVKSKKFTSDNVTKFVEEIRETNKDIPDEAIISQDEISASIGKDFIKSSIIALCVAVLAMIIYTTIKFDFKFSISALIALVNDVLITLGVCAIFSVSINLPFIVAILTIIGYSIKSNIVIFDRIRENRNINRRGNIIEAANKSITQTMTRTINATVAILIVFVCVYILVPSIRTFSLPVIVGILSGTYSSLAIAPSIWTILEGKRKKKNKSTK